MSDHDSMLLTNWMRQCRQGALNHPPVMSSLENTVVTGMGLASAAVVQAWVCPTVM